MNWHVVRPASEIVLSDQTNGANSFVNQQSSSFCRVTEVPRCGRIASYHETWRDPVVFASIPPTLGDHTLFEQRRWPKWAWLEIGAGFVWLSMASGVSIVAALPLWILGSVLLSAGVSHLVWPDDRRPSKFGALAGFVGALVAIPYGFALGGVSLVALLGTALAASWAAGRMAIQLEPHVEGVPRPVPTLALCAKVAADELILGFEQIQSSGFGLDGTIERIIGEIQSTHSAFVRDGFLENPEKYHRSPPELLDPEIRQGEAGGHRIDVLRFESGYAPREAESGRDRWMGYEPCRDGWAYVLRHPGPERPWIMCTNGYRMGFKGIDVSLFKRFFEDNGLNVLIPVLPLHGPRRLGLHSGTGFLGWNVIDTLHAEAQSVWDMRRLLSWIQSQGALGVGAFGLSLGGYTTSLFASLADGLDCVIAGIPLTDIGRMMERHGDLHQIQYAEHLGFDLGKVGEVFRVVSPLALDPRVPKSGRMIFGANADRLVPPDQVVDLWRHWEKPEIVWYAGSHVSFMSEQEVWAGVDRTLSEVGLVADPHA